MEGVENMRIQEAHAGKASGSIWVGTWGRESAESQNYWSFKLEKGYKLKKIIIDHGNDIIYSFKFTSQTPTGGEFTSKKFGGWRGGETVSEITFDSDEEIVGINGSVGTKLGCTVICSLIIKTNKNTHGPFGGATDSEFCLPWENGSLVGFYGFCGHYINSIAIYLKAEEEIMKIGTWGKTMPAGPQNEWSYKLEGNHHLKKISVDHGDLIYSLIFITQSQGLTYTSPKVGGWNGGDKVSEVTFGWNEEIIAISGTVALSRGDYPGHKIISSITFVTNQSTHGPFGDVRGTPFKVGWADGSFAGFYGLCEYYLDSIGVYLKKATN